MEEIFSLCNQIFQNLDLKIEIGEGDAEHLFKEDLFIEIYKIMFPLLDPSLEHLSQQDLSNGEKIQHLIDLLSSEILKMDLSHIRGDQISQANLQHLINFLQLLFEVSKLYNQKRQSSNNSEQNSSEINFSQDQNQSQNQKKLQESQLSEIKKDKDNQQNLFDQKDKNKKQQKQKQLIKNEKQLNSNKEKLRVSSSRKSNKESEQSINQNPTEQEIQNFAQSQNIDVEGRNVFDILKESIIKIKKSLEILNTKTIAEEDNETRAKLLKQKDEYKNLLKRYVTYFNTQRPSVSDLQKKNHEKKLKILYNKTLLFNQEFDTLQKSMYFKLRDEKVNYLRKIHRIVFELEKRKILDQNKIHREERDKRNQETRLLMEQMENIHRDQVDLLKSKIQNQKEERHTALVAQRQVVSQLEKELKIEKEQKLGSLYSYWNQEQEKFENMLKDDGILEQKIMSLYKNY